MEDALVPWCGSWWGVPFKLRCKGSVTVQGFRGSRREEAGTEVDVKGAHEGDAGTYNAEVYF